MVGVLVKWWYGEAITRIFKYIRAAYIFFADLFSVKICIRTMFDPWKRDEISYEGLSIQQKFQVWLMNLSSRFIGAVIKLSTLLGYVVFTIFLSVAGLLAILLWLIYPALIIYFIFRAVV